MGPGCGNIDADTRTGGPGMKVREMAAEKMPRIIVYGIIPVALALASFSATVALI